MPRMVVTKLNETMIRVLCDSATIRHDLKDSFSYFKPGYRYMPKFQMGIWDGRISLYNLKNQQTYLGLTQKIIEFAKDRECELEIDPALLDNAANINLEQFLAGFQEKHELELRDYQQKILEIAAREKKALILSATGSGKSFAIYALTRMIDLPTLLIVPSLQLVGQMYGDFAEYAEDDETFIVADRVQQIHGKTTKEVHKQVVVSTWQSLQRQPPEYFEQFKLVICDEAHEDKADKLREIIGYCTQSEFRYGFTGTLDDNLTNETILRGLFGEVHRVSSTSELMDRGLLADLMIKQVVLQYPDATRKERSKKKFKNYDTECEFLLSSPERMDFLLKLALRAPGNTLILFQKVEAHGEKIYEQLKQRNEALGLGRQIFLVHGGVEKDERLRIVNVAEQSDGVIIVASLGTFARGINIRNLENLIFAFGLKAKITILQSIGRALRIGRSNKATVFDICDDLSWKSWINYAMKHAGERLKIYQREKFNYQIIKVKIAA